MLQDSPAFSGFSVNDLKAAQDFYSQVLGLTVKDTGMGLDVTLNGSRLFIYEKSDHKPATFTVLNFPVEDIDTTVKALKDKGVTFEHYEDMTDDDGIARGRSADRGPDIAWFTDPAGNVLSVLH